MIGSKLAQYEIIAELGRGGMGIVYKATDTKLNRTVAIKVLPPSALASEDDRARFYREAQAAAQLHHPHIATVFEIEEAVPSDAPHGTGPSPFIVMEYIDGQTLEARIKEGPLKISEAVRLASQMADALKAAHAKDIIHRDIKSANVMLTTEGSAKILDFGLAKTAQSTMLTRMGSTLGTISYMSPEQAKGEVVDKRTDIWSLGVVLYEMVSGMHPYPGDYEQAIVYSILNADPEPLTSIRTGVPMELERIVAKLLAKETDRRYQTLADLKADLLGVPMSASAVQSAAARSIMASPGSGVGKPVVTGSGEEAPRGGIGALFVTAITVLTLAAGLAVGKWVLQEPPRVPDPPPVRRMAMDFPGFSNPQTPGISPDGKFLVFTAFDSVGVPTIVIYDFEKGDYAATYPGNGFNYPDFSPDGRWLAMSGIGSGVMTILLPDGSPQVLTEEGEWAVWDSNESMLYRKDWQLYRISANGGEPELVATADSSRGLERLWPIAVMHDKNIALIAGAGPGESDRHVFALDLESNTYRKIISNAMNAKYLDSGHLIYSQGGRLIAPLVVQAFDEDLMETYGLPVRLDIDEINWLSWNAGEDGTIVYSEPKKLSNDNTSWIDSSGVQSGSVPVPAGTYRDGQLSPDGSKLAVLSVIGGLGSSDLLILDLETSRSPIRLLLSSLVESPVWSSDGTSIYYSGFGQSGARSKIMKIAADGSGEPELIADLDTMLVRDIALLPDESSLIISDQRSDDLYFLSLTDSTITPFGLSPERREENLDISADGKFLAFTDSVVPRKIFVKEIGGEGEWEISSSQGYFSPRWSPSGDYLYFSTARGEIMKQRVSLDQAFATLGSPETIVLLASSAAEIDVDPDGSRILANSPVLVDVDNDLRFIFNFGEEAKRIAPVARNE